MWLSSCSEPYALIVDFFYAVSVNAPAPPTLEAKSSLTAAHGKFQQSVGVLGAISTLS